MNEVRLLVGMQAAACASASYLNALTYARERIQGKHLTEKNKDAPSVPIIRHPDVRRQLMLMKTYTEGMRSLLYYVSFCEDRIRVSDDPNEKARYQGIIDVLIPVAKGYVTDKAFEVCSHGVQVYGGYGYIKEYPQEQLLRDCRITMIYEGTNGIQAMDLLGRKLGMNKGQSFKDVLSEIKKTVEIAGSVKGLEKFAADVEKAVNQLADLARHIGAAAAGGKVTVAFAFAHPFLEVTGDITTAWMLLWRAAVAARQLEKGANKKDKAFYEGQVKSVQFFINTILPVTLGKMAAIHIGDGAAVEISEESFGGK